MMLIDELAERRIREAMERGDFDDLPGKGEPLVLDDDALVPENLRMAWRVLKNAGYVPEKVSLRREIRDTEHMLVTALDASERRAAGRRLQFLLTRLSLSRRNCADLRVEAGYFAKLRDRLATSPAD